MFSRAVRTVMCVCTMVLPSETKAGHSVKKRPTMMIAFSVMLPREMKAGHSVEKRPNVMRPIPALTAMTVLSFMM